ncbi:MAG: hypothetical protein LAT68_03140 [Cyclobacteriaceae bacterium]|nr:hypothetical protein [Cyclobacteriaceae bacterium]MCH8515302.1 hypothetical protein [Cyclobacteriaceae bacterium]
MIADLGDKIFTQFPLGDFIMTSGDDLWFTKNLEELEVEDDYTVFYRVVLQAAPVK